MDDKINDILKSINDLKTTQSKLINSINGQNQQLKSLTTKIDNIQSKMESYDNLFSDLNSKIDSISTNTSSLIDDVSNLNNRVNLLENDMANLSLEFIVTEFSERQRRANNILLFNLPEPKNASDPSDTAKFTELLNVLKLNTPPVRLSRLGKSSIKPRPIKVELSSSHSVFEILKAKHKLRSHNTFSSIHISTDRTAYQRNFFKNIVKELDERKKQGEQDLYLKYIRGVPVISKNGQTSQAD